MPIYQLAASTWGVHDLDIDRWCYHSIIVVQYPDQRMQRWKGAGVVYEDNTARDKAERHLADTVIGQCVATLSRLGYTEVIDS